MDPRDAVDAISKILESMATDADREVALDLLAFDWCLYCGRRLEGKDDRCACPAPRWMTTRHKG